MYDDVLEEFDESTIRADLIDDQNVYTTDEAMSINGAHGTLAEDEAVADAETEAVAEIAQPQRLRPDLPPNDLRLRLSRAHC